MAQVSGPMRPCCWREPGGDRRGGDRDPVSTEKLNGPGPALLRPLQAGGGGAGGPGCVPYTLWAEGL